MNFNIDNQKLFFIIAVVVITFYFLHEYYENNVEGYARPIVGGSYGPAQNEIFWYPYPHKPTFEDPGLRHAKYSPEDEVHSVSYIYPDFNVTINEPQDCTPMQCPPAFGGESVNCYRCPQSKGYDSGR